VVQRRHQCCTNKK